jgi:hypothetical protein
VACAVTRAFDRADGTPYDSGVVPDNPDLPAGPCRNVVITLDVFDNITGRSSLFLGHSGFIDNTDLIDDPNLIPSGTER